MEAGIDETLLKKMVNFLLTGREPPPNRPAEMRQLKLHGRLWTLLDGAHRQTADNIPYSQRSPDKLLKEYNGETVRMATDAAASGLDLSLRRKYDLAIQSWKKYTPGARGFGQMRSDTRRTSLNCFTVARTSTLKTST